MADPEVLLCDTSFVGLMERAAGRPDRIAHWPDAIRERLDEAILAISVITRAEMKAGYAYAGWGERRIERSEDLLRAYSAIPLDEECLNTWAALKACGMPDGWNVGDNDLWIAATAVSRELPLVTCDTDFSRIAEPRLDLLYLPAGPESRSSP